MIKLAGKYANAISRNPVASAVAGGLGAAGLATLGNVISGEAQEEGPGRVALEALGAAGLGSVMGSRIPAMRGVAAKTLRDLRSVVNTSPAATAHRAKMSERDIASAEGLRNFMREAYKQGGDPEQLVNQFRGGLRAGQALINTAGIPLGLTAAGAAGGMIGGGVANLGQFVGIPGLNQDEAMQAVAQQALDPEAYGSSNSLGARYKAPTTQYA